MFYARASVYSLVLNESKSEWLDFCKTSELTRMGEPCDKSQFKDKDIVWRIITSSFYDIDCTDRVIRWQFIVSAKIFQVLKGNVMIKNRVMALHIIHHILLTLTTLPWERKRLLFG
jgi:hypothetical protein